MDKKKQNEEIALLEPMSIVYKSNDFVYKKLHFNSIWCRRIIAVAAAQIKRRDKEFHTITIRVPELLEYCGLKRSGDSYNAIKKAIQEELEYKRVQISTKDHEQSGSIALCTLCLYSNNDSEDSRIVIRFSDDLIPYLLNLRKRFTAYGLQDYLQLKTDGVANLYEILQSWRYKVNVTKSLKELYEILDVSPYLRRDFRKFEDKFLHRAIEQINDRTTLHVTYEVLRKDTGKKPRTTGITFHFDPLDEDEDLQVSLDDTDYQNAPLLAENLRDEDVEKDLEEALEKVADEANACYLRYSSPSEAKVCFHFEPTREKCKYCNDKGWNKYAQKIYEERQQKKRAQRAETETENFQLPITNSEH